MTRSGGVTNGVGGNSSASSSHSSTLLRFCVMCRVALAGCSDQTVEGKRYQLKEGQVRACRHCAALDKGNVGVMANLMAGMNMSMQMNGGGGGGGGGGNGSNSHGGGNVSMNAGSGDHRSSLSSRHDLLPSGNVSGTPHLTGAPHHARTLSLSHQSQSLSAASLPIGKDVMGLGPLGAGPGSGHEGSPVANVGAGLGSNYMDRHAGADAAATNNANEDLDMMIPTATTPSTKYKRRSKAAAASAAAPKGGKVGSPVVSDSSSAASPDLLSLSSSPVLDPSALPESVVEEGEGEDESDDDEEEESALDATGAEEEEDDEESEYDEEDDYLSANNIVQPAISIDPTSPRSPMSAGGGGGAIGSAVLSPSSAVSFSRPHQHPLSPAPLSPRPSDVLFALTSSSAQHSLQLAEQQNEIQLLSLHRHRIHKVNKLHLLYVVASLVRAYEVEEKWIATVINFAERCTANLQVEPNKRSRHVMAAAVAAANNGMATAAAAAAASATAAAVAASMLDDHMDITPYVKIKSIPGGRVSECKLIEGVMFRKNIAHKKMRSFVKNPRVLLLGCALEYQRIENRLSSLDTVLEQEKEYIQLQINKILSWRPDVIVVEKSVSRLAQDLIRNAGVTLVLNVKPSLMARLSRATRATPIVPASDYVDKCASIGTCGRFIVETFNTQQDATGVGEGVPSGVSSQDAAHTRALSVSAAAAAARVIVMSFEECATRFHATILLRGAPVATLKRVKYILRMCIHVAYHLSLEAALLFDECATYSDANLERMQNMYHTKVAAMWGAQSEVAAMFLSRQARIKLKSDDSSTEESSGNGSSAAAAASSTATSLLPPPLPSTPAPMRSGYSIPLSSSPFVELSIVPVPQNIIDARRVLSIGLGGTVGEHTPPPLPPLWIHDCILFGSTWFSSAFQCFPPECKGIQFYTDTDKVSYQQHQRSRDFCDRFAPSFSHSALVGCL